MSFLQTEFLHTFFGYLNRSGVRYAVARNASTLPETIPGSDIDMLIHPADFRRHRRNFSEIAQTCGYRQWKCYWKNHSILQISFAPARCENPSEVVRIDFLMGGVFWMGIPVLRQTAWIPSRVLKNNVWQLEGPLMVAATLANIWVYGGRVKERYVKELSGFSDAEKNETVRILETLFGVVAAARVNSLLGGTLDYESAPLRRAFIFHKPWKMIFSFCGLMGMVRTLLSRLMHPPGIFVVLHGPDGCGKSAVSAAIKERMGFLFPALLHFHLFPKPQFLSSLDRHSHDRWSDRQYVSNEWELRQRKRGIIRSLFQIIYLTFRYWTGYLLCVYPALLKGKLVLGERWNLDFLTDPASKGFFLPLPVRTLFYGLCPRPHRLILLTGSAPAMAARKRELPVEEIARQIELNNSLFGRSRSAAFIDTTVEFEKTFAQVMAAIIK